MLSIILLEDWNELNASYTYGFLFDTDLAKKISDCAEKITNPSVLFDMFDIWDENLCDRIWSVLKLNTLD